MNTARKHSSNFYELVRKLIHLSSLVVPIAYLFFDKIIILGLIVIGLIIAVFIELLRTNNANFGKLFFRWFSPILRDSEKTGLTASTFMIIGALITVAIFPKEIAIFALFTVIISDTAAGLIGKILGKHILYNDKTWEGTTAFFISTSVISLFMLDYAIWNLLVISGIIAVVELLLKRYDNLIIPITSGLIVMIIGVI